MEEGLKFDEYLVMGILTNDKNVSTEIRLADTWKPAAEPVYKATMPKIEKIKIIVRNDVGEVIATERDLTINKQ